MPEPGIARPESRRTALVTVVLAGFLAAVAGCAARSPAGPEAQLTGVQLAAALLPQSYLPADYPFDRNGSTNSGDSLFTAPADANWASAGCAAQTAVDRMALGETAYANSYHAKGSRSTLWLAYGQTVRQFKAPAAAGAVFAGLRAAMARCTSFTVRVGSYHDSVSQQVTTEPPVDGHKAFLLRSSVTVIPSGDRYLESMLFVLDGPDHVVVSQESCGSPLPASRPLAAMAATLIPQVEKFSQSASR
jgi:hypothetical protein